MKITKALDCFITDIFPELEELIPPINKQTIQIDVPLLVEIFTILETASKEQNASLTNEQRAETIAELYQLGLYHKINDSQKIDKKFVDWIIKRKI